MNNFLVYKCIKYIIDVETCFFHFFKDLRRAFLFLPRDFRILLPKKCSLFLSYFGSLGMNIFPCVTSFAYIRGISITEGAEYQNSEGIYMYSVP